MNVNLLKTISIEDISNIWHGGRIGEGGLAVIAYETYDSEDEDVDYIDAVGVDKDKNIYFAKDYKDLVSLEQNGVYMKKCITRSADFRDMMCDVIHLIGRYNIPRGNAFVKNYMGYILPIREVIEDTEKNRAVFVAG